MKNYYQTLGVNNSASPEDIKRAYRRLASQHHPDKGGDKTRFQEIQEAYTVLSDPHRRAEYDNPGHININGHFGGAPFNFDSIFDIFGARFHAGNPGFQQRMQARMTLWVSLADIAQAQRRTISVGTPQGTQAVEIDIPPGINDGDTVQYSGVAPGGADLIVQFRIHANPAWQRAGLNITTEYTITIWDCVLGSQLEIRDLIGNQLSLTVPPRTQPGTTLRLRGRGLHDRAGNCGDLLVRIQAVIPQHIDSDLLALIQQKRSQ